jgi:predicted ABC-type ATPase
LNIDAEYGLTVTQDAYDQYLMREGKSWLDKAGHEKSAINISFSEFGYKNYLYFVCTVDPIININRVAQRVALKGHDVPQEKIINRYYSSLSLLPSLIPETYRTFLFDNSAENSEIKLIAEIEKGGTFMPKTGDMPWWMYDYVLSPLFS